MRRIETQQGYMKFWRLGPIEFGEQSRWSHAPRSTGLWAFPFPFYDSFFTYHKYTDAMPKRLREGNYEGNYEDQLKWIKNVGRKVLPVREFWYKGDVLTHFLPNGEIGGAGTLSVIGEPTDWTVMDTSRLAKSITSSGADKTFGRWGTDKGQVERFRSSVDHLEVFIAPGMGKIREGKHFKGSQ